MVVDGGLLSQSNLPELFVAGVAAAGAAGLSVDFVVKPPDLCVVRQIAARCPDVSLVLDHLAYGGANLVHFQTEITALAAMPNVTVKLCGFEEWDVGGNDIGSYVDFALAAFGYERCMFEGNWFVSQGMGYTYQRGVDLVTEALGRAGASAAETAAVMGGNAARIYRL